MSNLVKTMKDSLLEGNEEIIYKLIQRVNNVWKTIKQGDPTEKNAGVHYTG